MKTLQHPLESARRVLLTFMVLLVTVSHGGLGCVDAPAKPDLPPAQALPLRFPDQARLVRELLGDPLWTSAGSMTTTRQDHTATLLPDGQVLVVGGNYGGYLASAELYTSTCASAADCANAASGECESGLCDTTTGNCHVVPKLDGTPCKGGVCIAGGCLVETDGSSSGSSSGTGASGGASAGSGAVSTASSSGTTAPGASSSSAASSASGAGAGGSAEEIHLHGGACGIPRGPADGAPWIGLGVLVLRWRRPSRALSERSAVTGRRRRLAL